MATTPRFVTYNSKDYNKADCIYIIHCYQPRFVARIEVDANGIQKAHLHDNWDGAPDEEIKPILIKAKEWFYFKHKGLK